MFGDAELDDDDLYSMEQDNQTGAFTSRSHPCTVAELHASVISIFTLPPRSALFYLIIISHPFVIAEEQEYTLPREAFQLRHEIMDNPSAPEHLQQDKADSPHVSGNEAEVTCLTPIESFSLISISQPLFSPHLPASFFCPIVKEMLNYYAEQGDVQMAVSVLIVLGDRIRKEIDDLTQVRERKYTGGFLVVVKTAAFDSNVAEHSYEY